ncbi:type III secretion system export apparatus subunit SctS [Chitinivorax sp. B]|uniref:type III secretion system export apparatus subunit SctS n=1 Tax=Chitinivorax sp. B TaxID=2502235 RepID=UPI0010F8B894|nr:type III secretion system export apparatus subunit SctS [Chitinivorax sp. B]
METLVFFQKGLLLVVALSAPPLIVATLVGVLVSLLQGLLQLQDQTLPFVIKLLAVGVTLALTGGWIGGEIFRFALRAFDIIPDIGH